MRSLFPFPLPISQFLTLLCCLSLPFIFKHGPPNLECVPITFGNGRLNFSLESDFKSAGTVTAATAARWSKRPTRKTQTTTSYPI
ncbi:hypothetical protein B0J11DRAFT_514140 [Dendryphion nanum]|uniref:Secreted protein n=1 Tax=Dendryphion nanum TaxID=256645 RepID=A0A9P9EJS3_9PLEO|nr:hypothetical protein B0J11DRAFT_514140 [Dendryphion nanum]